MSKNDSKLVTKLSSLVEGQVPDFVQAEHPVFVQFLKHYYQYLEAGRLTLTGDIFYIAQETSASAYILEETDGDRIVTELGDGTVRQFIANETITGSTSKATATVLVDDSRNGYLYITSQQKFITGETITGGTSNSTATISEYRANPVQNIQQLLEYANTDNTIYDFLDQFRNSFMNAIPNTLATGTSKRNLIKSIRDIYSAKGTSEAHKIFLRLLLGEQPEITYPNQFMMKISGGDWGQTTIMRVTPDGDVQGDEVLNQLITGQTSGAIATVESATGLLQGTASITELQIAGIIGTFTTGEKVTATSLTRDVTVGFTVTSIVSSATAVNDGVLHSLEEPVSVESVGNGFATVEVNEIKAGGVSEVKVDDAGTLYEVGDTLTFTASSADTDISSATGFVSMIGGGIQLESGTLDDSDITTDSLILESRTQTHLEPFSIQLEEVITETFKGDGSTKVFTLSTLNTSTDAVITVYVDNVLQQTTDLAGNTIYTLSSATLTFTDAPSNNAKIFVVGGDNDQLLLDGTDISSTNAGHQILTEDGLNFEQDDTYTTIINGETNDKIVLEFDTFENLGVTAESGSIQRVHISDSGVGYTSLPTITVSTTTGTSAKLLALTDDIGAVESLKVSDVGFNYTDTNLPDLTLRAHFVVKDVSGTFSDGNTLTTHVGTVKGFNSNTNVLDTTFENVVRVEQEQTGTFQESIELEDGTVEFSGSTTDYSDATTGSPNRSFQYADGTRDLLSSVIDQGILLEDEQDFDDGENIILDGTEIVTPGSKLINLKVKVIRNATDTANIFAIDGVAQPTLVLTEGNTYYFDLSDSSLYNADTSKNHQLKFSETENGTHSSGSAYTTGVTTSASYIEIGTTGAYIQIVVATGAPELFYYCVNHSGMGGAIKTPAPVSFVKDDGGDVLLDGTSSSIFFIELESGTDTGIGQLKQEATMPTRPSLILLDRTDTDFADQGGGIKLEVGVDQSGTSLLEAEDNEGEVDLAGQDNHGGNFMLEVSTLSDFSGQTSATNKAALINNENEKVLIDRYREREPNSKLLLDGTDASSTNAGIQLATENAGRRLVLDGTDTDTSDANDGFLLSDETGNGDITLNGTDSDSIDAGDNIINESGIDFDNDNVTITDSSGATATIVKADIGTATSSVDTTSTSIGSYANIYNIVGEDLVRIQDSYYYQDYSYEVSVGQALSTYINELKKAVHPAGFQPFGKVSIASTISVAIQNAGESIVGFTGDDTFSPILASTFATLFEETIQARSEYNNGFKIGSAEEQIVYENGVIGGDKLVLDATSSSVGATIPSDVSIVLEDSLQPSGYDYDVAYLILNATDTIGSDEHGKLDLESGGFENEFENIITEDGIDIGLENGFLQTGDSILFEAHGTDVGTRNQFSAQVANDVTGRMMSEASNSPSGSSERSFVKTITTKITTKPTPRVTRNLMIYLAETPFGRTGNVSSLQLENSTTGSFESGVLILNGELPLKEDVVAINLESPVSRIVLNGTDSDGTNTGDAVLMENGDAISQEIVEVDTGVKDRVLLEDGGPDSVLLAEANLYSFPLGFTVSDGDRIALEDDNDDETIPLSDIGSFRFQDIVEQDKLIMELHSDPIEVVHGILLESYAAEDLSFSRIILDGTDSNSTNAGSNLEVEDFFIEDTDGISSPDQNNANAVENVGVLLEDFGQLLLDGTDSSSTDAEHYILQETTKRNRFDLETNGTIVTETFSTNSIVDRLLTENIDGGEHNIILEGTVVAIGDKIKLEDGGEFDRLILDGHDPGGDGGNIQLGQVLLESETDNVTRIALEDFNTIASEGQIPLDNWTLNSSTNSIGGQAIVRSTEIRTRTTGDIALEDSTVNDIDGFGGDGMLVLNGTDSSSTNAGDNFDLEGATGITV